jgi:hypothetical protein
MARHYGTAVTARTVEIFLGGERIAVHMRGTASFTTHTGSNSAANPCADNSLQLPLDRPQNCM